MNIDYTALRFWMDVGIYAFNIGLGLYVWRDKRKVKTAQRFQELEDWKDEQGPRIENLASGMAELKSKCAGHMQQTNQLGTDFKSMPTREDFTKLSDQMNTLSVDLGRATGRLSGIGRAVDLMNQHLLKKGGE